MIVNIEAVDILIKNEFNDNKAYFADEIGVSRSLLSNILCKKIKNNSPKVCNSIIVFCNRKNIDVSKFIIF